MEVEVDEDLYPLLKESATSLCFQMKGESQNFMVKNGLKNFPAVSD